MEMIIKKWGNSLATRIPKAIAETIGLYCDQAVNIEAKDNRIIITPKFKQKEYKIEELLSQCDSKNMELNEDDQNWLDDKAVGREWQW
jgi:antitoxin MazE